MQYSSSHDLHIIQFFGYTRKQTGFLYEFLSCSLYWDIVFCIKFHLLVHFPSLKVMSHWMLPLCLKFIIKNPLGVLAAKCLVSAPENETKILIQISCWINISAYLGLILLIWAKIHHILLFNPKLQLKYYFYSKFKLNW